MATRNMKDEIYDIFNRRGRKIGRATWTECHTQGLIHQTAAVLVFKDRTRTELLVQRRSPMMKQQPGVLSHSAGGHVLAGMTARQGVERELQEELFFRRALPPLRIRKVTRYLHHDMPNNFEFLSVFETFYPGPFFPNPKEVAGTEWINVQKLARDLRVCPARYAPSFCLVFKHYRAATRKRPVRL